VSTTTFEDAKAGDKVYSHTFGWGVIEYISSNDKFYPICVKFHFVSGLTCRYSYEGHYDADSEMQSLFWDMVEIEAPEKPSRSTGYKMINGIEIPDITFKPTLNEYYYTPMPNYPELCHLMMDFHSNRLTNHLSDSNLCYPYTEEGKEAAILHAKAMLKSN
jgi:hypothetical protein